MSDLVEHILAAYHKPLNEELPRLEAMARKVVDVHRDKQPEMLPELLSVYLGLKAELEQHMAKEEEIPPTATPGPTEQPISTDGLYRIEELYIKLATPAP